MEDRIRAKPPAKDEHKWSKGTAEDVSENNSRYTVTVNNNSDSESYELDISSSIFELFLSRIESSSVVGETVWFKKKGS